MPSAKRLVTGYLAQDRPAGGRPGSISKPTLRASPVPPAWTRLEAELGGRPATVRSPDAMAISQVRRGIGRARNLRC